MPVAKRPAEIDDPARQADRAKTGVAFRQQDRPLFAGEETDLGALGSSGDERGLAGTAAGGDEEAAGDAAALEVAAEGIDVVDLEPVLTLIDTDVDRCGQGRAAEDCLVGRHAGL